MALTFDILTPVKDAGSSLELCVRSTADQAVEVLHRIQCGGGVVSDRVKSFSHVVLAEAEDSGMYAALNTALGEATGDIIGHLNADEQYLPGVLKRVEELFQQRSDTDIICGDMIVTDCQWNPKSYRRAVLPPKGSMGRIPLTIPTCSLFFRRRLFDGNLRYDVRYKAISDAILVHALLPPTYMWYLDRAPYAVFSVHRANLSASTAAELDLQRLNIKPNVQSSVFLLLSWIRKCLAGAYKMRDVEIEIFAEGNSRNRVTRRAMVGWQWMRSDDDQR